MLAPADGWRPPEGGPPRSSPGPAIRHVLAFLPSTVFLAAWLLHCFG
jgi:hypothetical protein